MTCIIDDTHGKFEYVEELCSCPMKNGTVDINIKKGRLKNWKLCLQTSMNSVVIFFLESGEGVHYEMLHL